MYSKKHKLDKFYTKPEVAKQCIKHLRFTDYDLIIESSAGNGSFSKNIKHDGLLSFDLEPENDNIIKQDWFKTDTELLFKHHNDKFEKTVCGVGYNSKGKFKGCIGGVDTKSYTLWKSMLDRCYVSHTGKYTEYADVKVSEEWMDYQRFAEWFEHFYVEGWHIDKDYIKDGNKLYSKDYCLFLPPYMNNIIASMYGKGVHKRESGKYRASIREDGKLRHIGTFIDEEEAINAYKIEKEKLLKKLTKRFESERPQFEPFVSSFKILVGFNPPFGLRNNLSKAFIKHAIEFGDTIAMILPNVYNKHTLQSIFPKGWRLKKIVCLPENSFTIDGEEYHVPCSFFIFDKSSGRNLMFNENDYKTCDDFKYCKENEADFYMMGAGGKIKLPSEVTENNRGYWIKSLINIDELYIKLTNTNWDGHSSANGGVSWLTKAEVIKAYKGE